VADANNRRPSAFGDRSTRNIARVSLLTSLATLPVKVGIYCKNASASKRPPNLKDRIRIKLWSARQRSMALRQHALDGNVEWVKLLLRETGYETFPLMLTRHWWINDASLMQVHQRTKTAVSLMNQLLNTIDDDKLPKNIVKQIPTTTVDKNKAILKLWPRLSAKPTQ
jgi:hypothetical protein